MKLMRFLYVNFYSLLLVILGVVFFVLPKDYFYVFFKVMVSVWCVSGGIALMFQWRKKKRKIEILVARNRNRLRPDTFRSIGGTLCGQQMVGLALQDLRKTENYRALSNAEWDLQVKSIFGASVVDSVFKLRRSKKTERR